MPASKLAFSGYRGVWLFAMFDLPVKTAADKRRYARFRKLLLCAGFSKLQYSVYARYFPSEEASESHRAALRAEMPSHGQVRLITITDRQFGKMEVFSGKLPKQPERAPQQLLLF